MSSATSPQAVNVVAAREDLPAARQEGRVEVAPTDEASIEQKPARAAGGPARKIALGVLVLFAAILTFHVVTDQFAPSSSTGSVAAMTTLVAPRVAGEVQQLYVADNQAVKQGDPLFALDPRPFDLTVRQAEASLETALQTVEASSASLEALRAKVVQAESNLATAQSAADRAKALFDGGVSSQATFDGAVAQLGSAQTALDSARADLLSNEKRLGSEGRSNPQIATAQVQLEQAQLNRQFATVVAPADGVITNLRMAIGQFVNAGSPVLTFIEDTRPWITVDLRENQLANIDIGDTASVVFDAAPGRTFRGVVKGIAWGIDPGRTVANGLPQNLSTTRWFEPARSIPVQIELAENEQWPRNVRVGSKANALIFTGGEGNPAGWVAGTLQTVQSLFSILF